MMMLMGRFSCFARISSRALLATLVFTAPALAQTDLVSTMAANEVASRQHQPFFSYISEERSSRTGGHLWREKTVETPDGPLRRLLAVDGKPLSGDDLRAEQQRIDGLVAHPDEFRKLNANRKDDESHAAQLLQLLPKAFIITPDGERDGCIQFAFRPNPDYEPQSYEERVVHAMAGTVSLRQPMDRLCQLDAAMQSPVQFGFGLLGTISGGHFSLERRPVNASIWKTDRISVHLDGRILLLKSISRNQETVRTDITMLPAAPTLAQAAQLSAR